MYKFALAKKYATNVKLIPSKNFSPSGINFLIFKNNEDLNKLSSDNLSLLKTIQNNLIDKSLSEIQFIQDGLSYVVLKHDCVSSNITNKRQSIRKLVDMILSISESKKENKISIRYLFDNEDDIKWLLFYIHYLNYKYTKRAKESSQEDKEINIFSDSKINEDVVEEIKEISISKNSARNLVNMRADECTPSYFINLGKTFAEEYALKYHIFYDENLEKNNLNLIYNVGKGSGNRPGMIAIEYYGDFNDGDSKEDKKILALIGKGVTFDAGGNNIKQTGFMETMFADKGGACAVFEAFKTAVQMKLKKNIVVVIPLVENSCDGKAYRPSDILTSHKGLTVEITNTDAEGRLILADAMSWVQTNYKVDTLIELSTLTGAMVMGLGNLYAGLFCNNNELANQLIGSGFNYQEDLWRMPLNDEMKASMEGGVSDLVNSNGSRYGGAITAAGFLSYFIEKDVKWAHIDIAGPVLDEGIKYHKKNKCLASGVGVATLVNFMKYN